MTSSTKKTFLKYRITYLEMEKRPSFAYPPLPIKSVVLLEVEKVPLWYFISIYKEVGYKYEWTDILKQPKKITKTFLNDKNVMFFSMLEKGAPIGFFILDYREEKVCELSYIGLVSGSLGKGLGKYLFKTAILTAWDKKEITKLKVNTCSLDHKSALPLYQKLGFNPVQFKDTKRLKTFFN